ncbi:bifunctional protein-serine/threonine kinase/phosphatase [Marinobacter sp. OP 3.4]|uniref:bifunctional protein-serine/threonine kinase/phosphatase n=1 Tax=Marinobacter sp. OP 3.4 TaxID=3076501 RepID=UPI002E1C6A44
MNHDLSVAIGQYSHPGPKAINQDFHGARVPKGHPLASKGVAVALADGISSSNVSQVASQAAVNGFLADYYCTSDAWSVRKSAQRVMLATNSWLYAQTQQSQYRFDRDRGYVCTLSVMVLKSATAHLFHVGDARIYRFQGSALEQLTTDHRLWVSRDQSYLGRALGIGQSLEIDYRSLPVDAGDLFVLATDGVYEFVTAGDIRAAIEAHGEDLDAASQAIVGQALDNGSDDNLTVQLVRVDGVPRVREADELYRQLTELPFPPELDARMVFDGYRILRKLHGSNRSHVFLAVDEDTDAQVVLKTPSIDLRGDPAYLERFLMEEWIARRIDSAHVVRPRLPERPRRYLYIVMEYIDGQTLAQWMQDHPKPDLESVRDIIGQIARGLRAFHRLEMLHQDLKPANVMIDRAGTVRIVDFGATRVAGVEEMDAEGRSGGLQGTEQHSAPEYFLGQAGTEASDQFSLGMLVYQMLTGRLPYGVQVPRVRHPRDLNRLGYHPLTLDRADVPPWMDDAIHRAVHPHPDKRYPALSEFIHDLRHPNRAYLEQARRPLMERHPVAFWQGVSALLLLALVASFAIR